MAIQQILSDMELIIALLQKRVADIAIERAFELADMAVKNKYPDDTFSEAEIRLWSNYRFLLWTMNNQSEK